MENCNTKVLPLPSTEYPTIASPAWRVRSYSWWQTKREKLKSKSFVSLRRPEEKPRMTAAATKRQQQQWHQATSIIGNTNSNNYHHRAHIIVVIPQNGIEFQLPLPTPLRSPSPLCFSSALGAQNEFISWTHRQCGSSTGSISNSRNENCGIFGPLRRLLTFNVNGIVCERSRSGSPLQ